MNYLVHNASRSIDTRAARLASPTHGGQKQFICGGSFRLIRGKPVTLTEEQFKQHLPELQEKATKGLLYVTTADLRKIDLTTLAAEPIPPSPAAPHPPLDSVANDDPVAPEFVPQHRLDPPPEGEFVMPVPPPEAALNDNPIVAPEEEPVPPSQSHRSGAGKGGKHRR